MRTRTIAGAALVVALLAASLPAGADERAYRMGQAVTISDDGTQVPELRLASSGPDPTKSVLLSPDVTVVGARGLQNTTITTGVLSFSVTECNSGAIGDAQITADRIRGAWDPATTWEAAPATTKAARAAAALTQNDCVLAGSLSPEPALDVTTALKAQIEARAVQGWRLNITGANRNIRIEDPMLQLTVDPHAPVLDGHAPSARHPVPLRPGGELRVLGNATDEPGLVENLTLRIGATARAVVQRHADGPYEVRFTVPSSAPTGVRPLTLQAYDADGRVANVTLPDAYVDGADPVVLPQEMTGLPDEAPFNLTFNVTEDSCATYPADCVEVQAALDETALLPVLVGGEANNRTYNMTVPAQPPGTRTLRIVAGDAAGRVVIAERLVIIPDSKGPRVPLVLVRGAASAPSTQEVGAPVRIEARAADNGTLTAVEAVATLGGQSLRSALVPGTGGVFTGTIVLDAPGVWNVTVEARDAAGHAATGAATRITAVPAVPPRIAPPARSFVAPGERVTFVVTDLNLELGRVTAEASLGDGGFSNVAHEIVAEASGARVAVIVPQALDGERLRLRVRAADTLGALNETVLSVVVDGVPPALRVTITPSAPGPGFAWVPREAVVHVDVTDAGSGVTGVDVRAGGRLLRSLTGGGDVTLPADLGDGALLVVRATDGAGHAVHSNTTLRRDDAPPTVGLAMEAHTLLVTLADAGSGPAAAIVRAAGGASTLPAANGTHPVPIGDVRRGDVLHVRVDATDRVGHLATIHANLTVPNAPPSLTLRVPAIVLPGSAPELSVTDLDGDTIEAAISLRSVFVEAGASWSLGEPFPDVPPAEYTLTVRADDGIDTVREERTVVVGPGPWLAVTAPPAKTSGPLALEARVNRTASSVQVVADTGDVVALEAVPGEPGVWRTVWTADPDRYDLHAVATYPDGSSDEVAVGAVRVTEPGSRTLTLLIWLLVASVVLAAVFLLVLVVTRSRSKGQEKL